MASKLDQDPSCHFFYENPTSSIGVNLLKTNRQINGHEFNASLVEVISVCKLLSTFLDPFLVTCFCITY